MTADITESDNTHGVDTRNHNSHNNNNNNNNDININNNNNGIDKNSQYNQKRRHINEQNRSETLRIRYFSTLNLFKKSVDNNAIPETKATTIAEAANHWTALFCVLCFLFFVFFFPCHADYSAN